MQAHGPASPMVAAARFLVRRAALMMLATASGRSSATSILFGLGPVSTTRKSGGWLLSESAQDCGRAIRNGKKRTAAREQARCRPRRIGPVRVSGSGALSSGEP